LLCSFLHFPLVCGPIYVLVYPIAMLCSSCCVGIH
jgi:hypothetical protein